MSNSSNGKIRGVDLYTLLSAIAESASKVLGPSNGKVKINGKWLDAAAILEAIQQLKAPHAKAEASKAQAKRDIAARNSMTPEIKAFIRGVIRGLDWEFDSDAAVMTAFGIPALKPPRERTAAEKAASAEQGRRTRKLRAQGKDLQAPKVKLEFTETEKPPTPLESAG